jgi:hypothetical protein
MAASGQQRNSGGSPRHWGESNGKGEASAAEHFYTPEERERVVWSRTPASSRTGGARRALGFPCLESLTGGPQMTFQRWRESEEISSTQFMVLARQT